MRPNKEFWTSNHYFHNNFHLDSELGVINYSGHNTLIYNVSCMVTYLPTFLSLPVSVILDPGQTSGELPKMFKLPTLARHPSWTAMKNGAQIIRTRSCYPPIWLCPTSLGLCHLPACLQILPITPPPVWKNYWHHTNLMKCVEA